MKLEEIKGLFQMDTGSPSPLIISDDNNLFVTFYAALGRDPFNPSKLKDSIEEAEIIEMQFELCIHYSFGVPNNETLHGHPYHKLGLESYGFYQVMKSDLIERLKSIDSVHHRPNSEKWKDYNHYILTFHDNMFECVATGFKFKIGKESKYRQAISLLDRLLSNNHL